ncbi:carbohydrate kinase [Candidatus Geothermarchaeota archaeon]|nr:MAG: carbohydrate kinase [Candidatus Geothermarchaeota archaeon]
MEEKYILSFDIGTTTIKSGLVDASDFSVKYKKSIEAEIMYPRPGWAEIDPHALWNQILELSQSIIDESKVDTNNVLGLIYTAHMAGVIPIDKVGNPLMNMIIWLDERAAGLPRDIWVGFPKLAGYNLFKLISFLRVTGGAPSKTGKDPISKILWIRKNEPDVYNNARYFLDVKGFLIYKSTGNAVTSHDEASLTWLADTRYGEAVWYKPFFKKYNLDVNTFPKILDSTAVAGRLTREASSELNLPENLPVIVGSGDLTSAAVGSGAIKEGEPHIYIGTSDWIAAHIKSRKVDVFHYIGSLFSGIPRRYLLIAEQEVAAGALEWAMDILGIGKGDYNKVRELVESTPVGSNNLVFFPWLYGERSPIDDPYVRGVLMNFSFTHSKGDILRSIMEGVAYNIRWAYNYFEKLVGKWDLITIVGGGALFDVWCQVVSDVLGINLKRIKDPHDAGLRGIATIAAVGLGIYKSFEDAVSRYKVDKIFKPIEENNKTYSKLYDRYIEFYKKNKKIFRHLNLHQHIM